MTRRAILALVSVLNQRGAHKARAGSRDSDGTSKGMEEDMDITHYALLAELCYYPGPGFVESVGKAQTLLDESYPEAAEALRPFTAYVAQTSDAELEDLYLRSFAVQAIATLDVGYVLFGDDYKRGELLSNLNHEHNAAHIDCRGELADHLPNVLCLLAKMPDSELRQELIRDILVPAVRKIIGEFDEERISARHKAYKKHYKTLLEPCADDVRMYEHILCTIASVLEQDFAVPEHQLPSATGDFLQSVNTEMEIEQTAAE